MIQFFVVLGASGAVRLSRWFVLLTEDQKAAALLQLKKQLLMPSLEEALFDSAGRLDSRGAARAASESRELSLLSVGVQGAPLSTSVVFRRVEDLFVLACIDEQENTLAVGAIIDLWTAALQQHLGATSLSESLLSLNLDQALIVTDAMLQQGFLVASTKEAVVEKAKEICSLE